MGNTKDLYQKSFERPEDKELRQFVGHLQATLPSIGYLPSQFYVIPQIRYESLSARDVPTQLRRPSYEREDRKHRLFWLFVLVDLVGLFYEVLFTAIIVLFVPDIGLQLKKLGVL